MFTSHGLYRRKDLDLVRHKWVRFTVVYDSESMNGNGTSNKIFIDDAMHDMERSKTDNYPQGPGNMVLGRTVTNKNDFYSDVLIDDLAMWNRQLTNEEIVEIGEI